MEFRIGQISAQCPGCGATQFKIPVDERSGPRMNYLCAICGQATQYAKLVRQIARESQRQRRERLSPGSPDVPEPRPLADARGIEPMHGIAHHRADEEGRGGPQVEARDRQTDKERAGKRPDDRAQAPDTKLPS
jgi:hypothetical protein